MNGNGNGYQPRTRYHAEVKVSIGGCEARVNCFAEDLDDIFSDIGTILAMAPNLSATSHADAGPRPAAAEGAASREMANAELKAKQLGLNNSDRSVATAPAPPTSRSAAQQPTARPAGQPPAPASPSPGDRPPACPQCGTSKDMELIRFTSKKTGQPRQAWKCQSCNQWHWPDGNPASKGRAR